MNGMRQDYRKYFDGRSGVFQLNGRTMTLCYYRDRQEEVMNDKDELCRRLIEIYPEIEECGMDLDFYFDGEKKAWVVDLVKDAHELLHYLDTHDAHDCLEGNKCVSLGHEIAQLKKNIKESQC
jgi:hypothetical protein